MLVVSYFYVRTKKNVRCQEAEQTVLGTSLQTCAIGKLQDV